MKQLAATQLAVVPLIMTQIYTCVAVRLLIVKAEIQLAVVLRVMIQI